MNIPYLARLVVLGLASFFLVHLAISLALVITRRPIVGMARRFRPRQATRFLLAIRLAPATLALLGVAGLCVPSYLWLEPEAGTEAVGVWCLAAATLGVAIWAMSILRAARAVTDSTRRLQEYDELGGIENVLGFRALVVNESGPLFAMGGIFHPRLLVSRNVVSILSKELLSSALDHELAHRSSRDNLKRLLLLLAPDMIPFVRALASFDRAWAKFSEWAADDEAVGCNPDRSVTLAAALLQVARLGVAPRTLPLATSLLGASEDLSERVDRLLGRERPGPRPRRVIPALVCGTGSLLLVAAFWSIAQPATFSSVYCLLEKMLR